MIIIYQCYVIFHFNNFTEIQLQEFPPASNLDPKVYGNQNSSITKDDIEKFMDGLTVDEVLFLHR